VNVSVNNSANMNKNCGSENQALQHEIQQFIGWQCRIRQHVVRKQEGRPSAGMRPDLYLDGELITPITINLMKEDASDVTAEFQHIHRKTFDPKARYESGLKILCEYYYQRSNEFDHEMSAVFSLDSELAAKIVASDEIELRFDQSNQSYRLKCNARTIPVEDEKYEATYWHNALFNPNIPGVVTVVGFNAFEVITD